jgi:hypothetical protein
MRAAVGRELPGQVGGCRRGQSCLDGFSLNKRGLVGWPRRAFPVRRLIGFLLGRREGHLTFVEQLAGGMARCCSRYGGSGRLYRFMQSGTSAATLGQEFAVLCCRMELCRRLRLAAVGEMTSHGEHVRTMLTFVCVA